MFRNRLSWCRSLVALFLVGVYFGLLPGCVRFSGWSRSVARWQPSVDDKSGAIYATCLPNRNLLYGARSIRLVVVVPFPPSQWEDVLDALSHWSEYSGDTGELRNRAVNLKLLLLCSRWAGPLVLRMQDDLERWVLRVRPPSLFADARLIFANLSAAEDAYYYSWWRLRHISPGTGNLFYPLFASTVMNGGDGPSNKTSHVLGLASDYDYFLWLEPDVRVIRRGFLVELVRLVEARHPFWVMGSAAQYTKRFGMSIFPYDYHINGNAVYRLGDECFRTALLEGAKLRYPGYPIDGALQLWRYSAPQDAWWRTYSHLFLYTDWIRNYGRRVWCPDRVFNTSPGTFVVHGRNRGCLSQSDRPSGRSRRTRELVPSAGHRQAGDGEL